MTRTALAFLTGCLCLGLAAVPLAAQETEQGMEEGEAADERGLEARVAELEARLAEQDDEEDDDADSPAWDFSWDNGFELVSPEGDLVLEFGGRVQNDWAWYSADDDLEAVVGSFGDGTEFRRARIFFAGELYDRVEFNAQYDFAGGDPEFKDVYLGLINLPVVGGVRVGHFKEPFSLEELTSSKYLTFLERAMPIEAFAPVRNTGFMLHDARDRFTWAVGAFRDTDDFGDGIDRDEVNLTARVTGVPWTNEDGSRLVHLGLSASEREPTNDAVRFRSRPESHLAPRIVDTGSFGSDGLTLIDAEAAVVHGPFSAQGEWVTAQADGLGGADVDADGFYVFGSWFPTGEHRPYKGGVFGRVKPRSPWRDGGPNRGWGAWEIALRYSSLDLEDGPVAGGEVDDVTLGVNWYPFANVRWMANYVMSDRDDIGSVDTFQMRFQFDF